jgi:hypothetical protein
VGSAHEPYLGAFVPPQALAARLMSGVPFLIAARQWEGPFAVPWKVNTFGDPFVLIPPPDAMVQQRVEQPVERGADLRASLPESMRQAKEDSTGKAAGQAMRVLNMLGRDDVAAKFWQTLAGSDAARREASLHVLPVFMRRQDATHFMEAWRALPHHTPRAESMLWHLMGPQLSGEMNPDDLVVMQSAIRADVAADDIERLAPSLAAQFGRGHVLGVIQREADRAEDRAMKRKLEELAQKFR